MPANAKKRTSLRSLGGLDATCSPLTSRTKICFPARVKDISETGIRMVVNCRMPAGDRVLVKLFNERNFAACSVVAWVRQSVPQGPNHVMLGCEFSKRLSERDLAALLKA